MNQENNPNFAPALSDENNINTPTNEIDSFKNISIKIYDGVAECIMNDSDNLKSVKLRAKNLAQENVQKKITDYVFAFLKERYLTLPDDEISSIADEISNIIDVKYNVLDSDDNIMIRATVIAQIDNNDIMNCIIRFFKEREELKSQNESLRNENENLKRQIEDLKRQKDSVAREKSALDNQNNELRRQVEDLKRQNNNIQQNNNLTDKSRNYMALILFDKAFNAKNYNEAVKLYDEAIQLNPNSAKFYYYRGVAHKALGNWAKSKEDFAKAKKLGW